MALKLIKFLTDTDGPNRAVNINPEYVVLVEADTKRPDQFCFITLCSGHCYRVPESESSASKRLTYGL